MSQNNHPKIQLIDMPFLVVALSLILTRDSLLGGICFFENIKNKFYLRSKTLFRCLQANNMVDCLEYSPRLVTLTR